MYMVPKCKAIDVATMKVFCGSAPSAKASLGSITKVDMGW